MRRIGAKYHISWQTAEAPDPDLGPYAVEIIKTSTGEPIPVDEPLFLFRARDRLACTVLKIYAMLCELDDCAVSQVDGVEEALSRFKIFRRRNPDRMKQPGTAPSAGVPQYEHP